MANGRERVAAEPKVGIDDILRADPHALRLLAAGHRATWQCLAMHMSGSEACPPDLVRALLAISDLEGWATPIVSAYMGLNPDDGMSADYDFRRWLSAGITRTFPATDVLALEVRYKDALNDLRADAATHTRQLTVDIDRAGDSKEHRALLGRANVLLARHLGEELDQDGAIAASRAAEDVFDKLDDAVWRAYAVRMRGAALLRLRKIDEALAALDTVTDAPSPAFTGRVQHRPQSALDPIDAVLYEAGLIAVWGTKSSAAWIRVLGSIAEMTGHRGCAERFEAGAQREQI